MPQPEDPMFAEYMKEIEAEIPALMNQERADMSKLAYAFLGAHQYLSQLKEKAVFTPNFNTQQLMAYFKAQVSTLSRLSGDASQRREAVLLSAQVCIRTLQALLDSNAITEQTQLAELLQIIDDKLTEYADVSGELEK